MCYDNLDNNQPSTLLFLDIKKAFDSVLQKIIKKARFLWYPWNDQLIAVFLLEWSYSICDICVYHIYKYAN